MSVPERSSRLRLFVAIQPSAQVRAALTVLQTKLQKTFDSPGVRWVSPAQLHLTLRFLGYVPADHLAALIAALGAVARTVSPLRLVCRGMGAFPSPRRPRVLWAGLEESTQQLPELQKTIVQETLFCSTEPDEKRFSAHLTLARVKELEKPLTESLAPAIDELQQVEHGRWTAESIELMRSQLASTGAVYECVKRFELASN